MSNPVVQDRGSFSCEASKFFKAHLPNGQGSRKVIPSLIHKLRQDMAPGSQIVRVACPKAGIEVFFFSPAEIL